MILSDGVYPIERTPVVEETDLYIKGSFSRG